jgi:hypothetical protein
VHDCALSLVIESIKNKVMKKVVNSIKEISRELNISYYKARQIKEQIAREIKEKEKDYGIPDQMIFNGRYYVEQFKRYL